MDQVQVLQQTVDAMQRKLNELGGAVSDLQSPQLGSPLTSLQPIPATTPPSAANQLRDGEFGSSVDNWFNPPPGSPTADVGKECAFFFSHDAPVPGQSLDVSTDARTTSVNNTLKSFNPAHSTYNPAYCDWDRSTGEARLQGDKTLDAPFPSNRLVTPNRAVEYVGFLAARRNSTIVIQDDNHLFAGVWDKAAKDWVSAANAFSVTATVGGTPGATTERRYAIYARTDRGYSFLSAEYALLTAPDDASFGPSVDVELRWTKITGILEYWVFRFDVTAAKYRLLTKIGSGANTYGDNNSVLAGHDDEGGYPVGARDRGFAYVASPTGDLRRIPVDGGPWIDVFLNIPIPADYDLSTTTEEQVLRVGMTKALDRQMVDVISTATSTTVQSATAVFTAADTGRTATLSDADGNVLHGPEAITFVDATHATFATAVATTNVDAMLYIEEGGDHGLLIDALHTSYVGKSAFAPYPDDTNRLQNGGQDPIAAPNHSSQGGPGGSGGGDPGDGGVGGCIPLDCPAWVFNGERAVAVPFVTLVRGQVVASGSVAPNYVQDLEISETDNLHVTTFENGVVLPSSPGQRLFVTWSDYRGTAVKSLKAGDYCLTMLDGRVERSRILSIVATGERVKVGSPHLSPGHIYCGGYLKLSWMKRLWRWLWPKDRGPSAVLLHNRKANDLFDLP